MSIGNGKAPALLRPSLKGTSMQKALSHYVECKVCRQLAGVALRLTYFGANIEQELVRFGGSLLGSNGNGISRQQLVRDLGVG